MKLHKKKVRILLAGLVILTIITSVLCSFAPPIIGWTVYSVNSFTETDVDNLIAVADFQEKYGSFNGFTPVACHLNGSTVRLYCVPSNASWTFTESDGTFTLSTGGNNVMRTNFTRDGFGMQYTGNTATIASEHLLFYRSQEGRFVRNESFSYATGVDNDVIADCAAVWYETYNVLNGYESALDEAESEGYADGFNQGFSNGYTEGESVGYSNGYTEGESVGYEQGLRDGYDTGVVDGFESGFNQGYADGLDQGFADGLEEGESRGYQSGLTDGYSDGFNKGVSSGYNSGLVDGYDSGFADGYTEGYDDGYAAAEPGDGEVVTEIVYQNPVELNIPLIFDGVADAANGIFKSVDFNIFGINILGVLLSITILFILVFIFKKFKS